MENIQVKTETGNYLIIKQELDGGFICAIIIMIAVITTANILIKWATKEFKEH